MQRSCKVEPGDTLLRRSFAIPSQIVGIGCSSFCEARKTYLTFLAEIAASLKVLHKYPAPTMSGQSGIRDKISSATSAMIWRAATQQFTAHHQLWNLLLIFLSSSLWPWSKAELPQKDICSHWSFVFTSISGGSICGGWSDKDLCAMMSLLTCFFCMEQTKTKSNFVRNIP